MKSKKLKIAAISLATISVISGILYYQYGLKKPYDYADYYVDVLTSENTKKTNNEEASEKELSLSLLKKTNSDIVGILEFDNRVIYEPIVQAPDNDYYVRKNIEKKYSAAGIPFISSDGNINSKNVVVYGHSSKWNNILFTPLMNYTSYDYYKGHPTFKFITESETRTYKIFCVMNIDLNNLDDSLEFSNSSWRSDIDFSAFISSSLNNSLYKTGATANTSDSLITLVTCDTRDNNKRIVVLAKWVQDE